VTLGADFLDCSGRFSAEPARQSYRIEASAYVDVDKVDADGGLTHACLAGAGLGDLDLLPHRHLWAAVL
jgi:hypothetical protein